jgi:hypothetical protein
VVSQLLFGRANGEGEKQGQEARRLFWDNALYHTTEGSQPV